jgi:hypothetical protein
METHSQSLRLHEPATYQIIVEGRLDQDWSDCLQGMTISTKGTEDRQPKTTLIGQLVDQAALLGVLNTLYNLGVSLVSVERLSVVETVE